MAADTVENKVRQSRHATKRVECLVAEGEHIYEGSMVFSKAGYGCADPTEGPFMGISEKEMDNTNGSDGDIKGDIFQDGMWLLHFSDGDAAQADVQTVANAATTAFDIVGAGTIRVGTIVAVESATKVWVEIDTQIEEIV